MDAYRGLVLVLMLIPTLGMVPDGAGSLVPSSNRITEAVDWGISVIDGPIIGMDDEGVPHITFVRSNGIEMEVVHAIRGPSEWANETVWSVNHSNNRIMQLDMDFTDDLVHIAFTYQISSYSTCIHGVREGGSWKLIEMAWNAELIGLERSGDELLGLYLSEQGIVSARWSGHEWNASIIDKDGVHSTSEVSDSYGDLVYVCYRDWNGSVHLLERNEGRWDRFTIDHDVIFTSQIKPEMVVDHTGCTIFAYPNHIFKDGRWEELQESTWTGGGVFAKGPDGKASTLWFDHNDGFCISNVDSLDREHSILVAREAIDDPPWYDFYHFDQPVVEGYDMVVDAMGIPHLVFINVSGGSYIIEYDTWSKEMPLNLPPEVHLSSDVTSDPSILEYNLTFSVIDPDGDIVFSMAYLDSPRNRLSEGPNRLWIPGEYTIHLIAWDRFLASTEDTITMHVSESPTRIDINTNLTRIEPGGPVGFTAVVEGGSYDEIEWDVDIGDSNIATSSPHFNYTFNGPGEYRIFAIAKFDDIIMASSYITISVEEESPSGEDGGHEPVAYLLPAILCLLVVMALLMRSYHLLSRGGGGDKGRGSGGR